MLNLPPLKLHTAKIDNNNSELVWNFKIKYKIAKNGGKHKVWISRKGNRVKNGINAILQNLLTGLKKIFQKKFRRIYNEAIDLMIMGSEVEDKEGLSDLDKSKEDGCTIVTIDFQALFFSSKSFKNDNINRHFFLDFSTSVS